MDMMENGMRDRFRDTHPDGAERDARRGAVIGLLAMCVVLAACAEPAPVDTKAAAPAPMVSQDATAARMPATDTRDAASATQPTDTSRSPAAPAEHAAHAAPSVPSIAQADTSKKAPPTTVDASLPRMQVHKSPSCGCCSLWVDHMRQAGFAVEVHDTHDLAAVKSRLGVPLDVQSCHTAEVGGLVVEGHVPASDIKRALAQGDTRALLLPGMPVNSPGMEMPGVDAPPYTVERITADGMREPFATHGDNARER
jgi:hypothetical protein